jgi:hypothetical protein
MFPIEKLLKRIGLGISVYFLILTGIEMELIPTLTMSLIQ